MVYAQKYLICLSVFLLVATGLPGGIQIASGAACTAYDGSVGHQITFTNNSAEDVVIGIWGTEFEANGKVIKPFKGYADPSGKNWQLKATAPPLTWCAPQHFNGRFFARTGCVNGVCKTGNCCVPSNEKGYEVVCSSDNKCFNGPEPATLAEVYVDDVNKKHWYDISVVDGYDFGMTITPSRAGTDTSKDCKAAGCKNLPPCPWSIINGTCLGPYKQYVFDASDYKYQQDYIILSAMCAKEKVCGCGAECSNDPVESMRTTVCPNTYTVTNPFTKQPVTLTSSGCSPENPGYHLGPLTANDARLQITCKPDAVDDNSLYPPTKYTTYDNPGWKAGDPVEDKKIKCHPWPDTYKKYVTQIADSNYCGGKTSGVYSWQYRDSNGLFQCDPDQAGKDTLGFAITIEKRLPNDAATPRANQVIITPSDKDGLQPAVTGSIWKQIPTKDGFTSKYYNFVGPYPLYITAKNNDVFALFVNCAQETFSLGCSLIYNSDTAGNGSFVVNKDPDFPSGAACTTYEKTPNLALGLPDALACSSGEAFIMNVAPGADVKGGHVCVGNDPTAKLFSKDAFKVTLQDKDSFRVVEDCGNDKNGNPRILDCTATFSLANGFTPKVIDGQSAVCTNNRIDWVNAFKNKNFGIGAFVADVDCLQGTYRADCKTSTKQDAQNVLRMNNNMPVSSANPLKMDSNNDGKIDMIDSINILRRSVGR